MRSFSKFKMLGALLTVLLASGHFSVFADDSIPEVQFSGDPIIIAPLFEYVVAPDELPDLQSRTDYIMEHFWEPFDFKNTNIVDQNALNHAFEVYANAMAYASPKKVEESVKKLIGNIKNNPGLSFQFAKAAEEALYSPRSELSGDDIYIYFLQNVVNNKKIRDTQKRYFVRQLEMLQRSANGAPLPDLGLKNSKDATSQLSKGSELTLLQFTVPGHPDSSYTNLKLDISSVANDLIEDGRLAVNVIYIADSMPENRTPDKWQVFFSPSVPDILSIRLVPGFYILDKDGKIMAKNLSVDEAINFLELVSTQN